MGEEKKKKTYIRSGYPVTVNYEFELANPDRKCNLK
jgi:hypothetical protein